MQLPSWRARYRSIFAHGIIPVTLCLAAFGLSAYADRLPNPLWVKYTVDSRVKSGERDSMADFFSAVQIEEFALADPKQMRRLQAWNPEQVDGKIVKAWSDERHSFDGRRRRLMATTTLRGEP